MQFIYSGCRSLEVRDVFYSIGKLFESVWHKSLLFNLKYIGASGNLLSWFSSYLYSRKQKLILPKCKSKDIFIYPGVPQVFVLGPLLFLIYINYIVREIQAKIRLFTEDTSFFLIVESSYNFYYSNSNIQTISSLAAMWLVKVNYFKY